MLCPLFPEFNAEDFTMIIRQSLAGPNAVEIEFVGTETPLPILLGTANGNVITVPEDSYEIALDENNPDIKTMVDMSAVAELNDDATELTAQINATIIIPISCNVLAIKQ
jgi:hypothetical protein